jgi:hypothetical protein
VIIVQLLGGLGNQMFQYAAARSVSIVHNVPLKLDITEYENYPDRAYKLNHFTIHAGIATQDEIETFRHREASYLARMYASFLEIFRPYYKRKNFIEQSFRYDANILKCNSNVYLEGYWQSEKYFRTIPSIIRDDFTFADTADEKNQTMAEQIESCESVSLHVRRGDYVSNPVTNAYHGTCTRDYYRQAIELIEEHVDDPRFFIFSDDSDWVQKNMDTGHPTTFIDFNGPDQDYEDMRLMSLCQHHIIANSSFSWWGAWLSANPKKTVIAPARWFNNPEIDTSDLVPESWLRI